ncbi:MAG: hypothetical protein JSU92_05310 [Deltaproteobacteria bacterium]|nr:MAG: hypothetical protein JSU92_05310 [Deltaproteobacteria bacterium]
MAKRKKGTNRSRRPTGRATFDEMGSENINKVKEKVSDYKIRSPIQEAIDFGIDVTLLYDTLTLTPTERIELHQRMLETAEELRKAGKRKNARS